LSPQKTKFQQYFDKFNDNPEEKVNEYSQEPFTASPRTQGCETIRTITSTKNGSKQRRSRKNRSKSGTKISAVVKKSILSHVEQKQEKIVE
jgi:hypothetical protein|tara:strand:- start:20 stop:292 length:273 start_codon:yes stop_codon:yes gene_type:complete